MYRTEDNVSRYVQEMSRKCILSRDVKYLLINREINKSRHNIKFIKFIKKFNTKIINNLSVK